MERSVLIVTEAMMPFCKDWGSCQRVYHYAKSMVAAGFRVYVICKNLSDRSPGSEILDGICVITQDHGKNEKKDGVRGLRNIVKKISSNHGLKNAIRPIYRIMFSEPNEFRGKESKNWAFKTLPLILDTIKKEKIDLVILSGPPFGLFYNVAAIKTTGAQVVLDYRDPWTLWYERFTFAERKESEAIELSDYIITSTISLSDRIKEKFHKSKVYPVLNGFNSELWNELNSNNEPHDKLIISYIGFIMVNSPPAFRDPTCFINASYTFLQNHHDVKIQFVGVGDSIEEIDTSIQECICFQKSVPVKEALEILCCSDVGVVIHTAKDHSGNYIVCGKLYDYLRSGKFVLSVGDKAACNNDLIDRYNAGIHCANDENEIINALENVYDLWKNNKLHGANPDDVANFSREYQNEQLINLINTNWRENK